MTPPLIKTETPEADAIVTELDISHLVIEDDSPVDNFQSEKQQRLLVEPLYSSQCLPTPFLAAANVGLFYKLHGEPIVPDVFLSLGVECASDFSQRRNRTYFVWEFGKAPDVCIEIVSNPDGDEVALSQRSKRKGKNACKKDIYAQVGVPYYVVFDPLQQIQGETEMQGALLRVWTLTGGQYRELTPADGIVNVSQSVWLGTIGLGLTLWDGSFEETAIRTWLRWCNAQGQVILTGAEGQEAERQRADLLAQKLRELGINPDEV
ncbi:Uma2 family endonuclease [Synechococcales cyanobacterium C]|uniref:Uma2 family endonuclease n=1 Tax=Petrachloros mirabilis ULC683 TaxID=2781853 RepID=A0A8K1ZZX0_9CYAN|nr:Uma2 family endonuclease [Petrachloros mirabilis]NCJ07168.1 Uma2 family endonuclease [Petrachloros mirabilis ULC683]